MLLELLGIDFFLQKVSIVLTMYVSKRARISCLCTEGKIDIISKSVDPNLFERRPVGELEKDIGVGPFLSPLRTFKFFHAYR